MINFDEEFEKAKAAEISNQVFGTKFGYDGQTLKTAISCFELGAGNGVDWSKAALKESYNALKGMVNPVEALLKVHGDNFEIKMIFTEHLAEIKKAIKTTEDLLGVE
jgi:hypothetical protein